MENESDLMKKYEMNELLAKRGQFYDYNKAPNMFNLHNPNGYYLPNYNEPSLLQNCNSQLKNNHTNDLGQYPKLNSLYNPINDSLFSNNFNLPHQMYLQNCAQAAFQSNYYNPISTSMDSLSAQAIHAHPHPNPSKNLHNKLNNSSDSQSSNSPTSLSSSSSLSSSMETTPVSPHPNQAFNPLHLSAQSIPNHMYNQFYWDRAAEKSDLFYKNEFYKLDPNYIKFMQHTGQFNGLDFNRMDESHFEHFAKMSKRTRSTYPFGKCKVCNDKATGIHYGIATCEGCKGFFKRSTLRKEKYRCFFGNNCPLTPHNRNRCKSCRFKKCLEVGMSIQGVKMGRIPKAEKERALQVLKHKSGSVNMKISDSNTKSEGKEHDGHSLKSSAANNDAFDEYDDTEEEESGQSDCETADVELTEKPSLEKMNESNTACLKEQQAETNSNGTLEEGVEESFLNKMNKSKSFKDISTNIINDCVDENEKMRTNDETVQVSSIIAKNLRQYVNKHDFSDDDDSASTTSSKSHKSSDSKKEDSGDISNHLQHSLNINIMYQDSFNDEEKSPDSSLSSTSSSSIAETSNLTKTNDKKEDSSDIVVYKERKIPKKLEEFELDCNKLTKHEPFSIYDLLKTHAPFQSSNLIINKFHSNVYNPKLDDSYHIISTLLSDKVYQLYVEHNEKVVKLYERAIKLVYQDVKTFEGDDATITEVWDGLLESIPHCVKCLITLVREIPGLNEISQKDLTTIINNRLFDYFIIKHSALFINGESFMMLPNNIQYTRKWMNCIIGEEMVDAMFKFANEFNNLRMTPKEISLIYPFIFTTPDDNFEDPATIRSLNEYYYRAILYEFDLNRRSKTFLNKWKNLLAYLPRLNELQAQKIGSLTPKSLIEHLNKDNQSSFKNLLTRLESLENNDDNEIDSYYN